MIWCRTYTSPNKEIVSDPINLVFFGNAPAATIAGHLQTISPTAFPDASWEPTPPRSSHKMYAYIDDTENGGRADWKLPDADLSFGPVFSRPRVHIRIYDGNVPDAASQLSFGRWSIAAVHLEHYSFPIFHVIHGWKQAQQFVQDWFTNQPFVDQLFTKDLDNRGWYQGYYFDGLATFIEITEPQTMRETVTREVRRTK